MQLPGPEHSRDQAGAVEHHPGGPGTVDHVLQRRFAAETFSLQEADHHVAGHTGHFDGQEQHQQVVGRGHQHHADRGTDQQRVEIGAVLVVGNPAENRQCDHQHQEDQQEQSEKDRQSVVDQQAAEQLGVLADLVRVRAIGVDVAERDAEGDQRSRHGDPVTGHLAVDAQQATQQQGDHRAAQHQFRQECRHVTADLGRQFGDQLVD